MGRLADCIRSLVFGAVAAAASLNLRAVEMRPLNPVSYRDVHVFAGFWKSWQETNRKAIVPYVMCRLEQDGHIENFAKAAGAASGPSVGEIYYDSDVYKLVEGAPIALEPSPVRNSLLPLTG